jgi:hypothetical protein
MQTENEPRLAGHGSIGRSFARRLVGIVPPGNAANTHPEYLHPPSTDTLDRARIVFQVATVGEAAPVATWLSLTTEDREALRETRAWHQRERARLRREHAAVADAMPPVSERGMRWRLACSKLPPDQQDAVSRMDEHERAATQLAATERAAAPIICHRRERLSAARALAPSDARTRRRARRPPTRRPPAETARRVVSEGGAMTRADLCEVR